MPFPHIAVIYNFCIVIIFSFRFLFGRGGVGKRVEVGGCTRDMEQQQKKKKRKIGRHIVLFGINRNCFLFATQKKKKKKRGTVQDLERMNDLHLGESGGEGTRGGKDNVDRLFPVLSFSPCWCWSKWFVSWELGGGGGV